MRRMVCVCEVLLVLVQSIVQYVQYVSDEKRGMRENETVCMNVCIYLKTVNLITCQRNEKKRKRRMKIKLKAK